MRPTSTLCPRNSSRRPPIISDVDVALGNYNRETRQLKNPSSSSSISTGIKPCDVQLSEASAVQTPNFLEAYFHIFNTGTSHLLRRRLCLFSSPSNACTTQQSVGTNEAEVYPTHPTYSTFISSCSPNSLDTGNGLPKRANSRLDVQMTTSSLRPQTHTFR